MAFADSLSAKVAEIRREALNHYEAWELHPPSGELGRVSADGKKIVMTAPGVTDGDGVLQNALDRLNSDLDELEERLSKFYVIESTELKGLPGMICPPDVTHLGRAEFGTSLGPSPRSGVPNYAVQRLGFAAHMVTEAADPHSAVWEGQAAEAFNRNFLRPFQGTRRPAGVLRCLPGERAARLP